MVTFFDRTLSAREPAVVILLALLLGTPAAAVASDPVDGEARSAALLLQRRLNRLQGLVASFTQTLESPALPSPQVESGTVYLLRPGRMRWEYEMPPGKLAISDGVRALLYLPEERQVLVAPLSGQGRGPGIDLLMRERVDLLAEFNVGRGTRGENGSEYRLVLTPRNEAAEYSRLEVEIGDDDFIGALIVIDPLGGTVTYRFDEIRLATDLEEALFRFEPPDGVEIQELGP